jgi:hypothetical protein
MFMLDKGPYWITSTERTGARKTREGSIKERREEVELRRDVWGRAGIELVDGRGL